MCFFNVRISASRFSDTLFDSLTSLNFRTASSVLFIRILETLDMILPAEHERTGHLFQVLYCRPSLVSLTTLISHAYLYIDEKVNGLCLRHMPQFCTKVTLSNDYIPDYFLRIILPQGQQADKPLLNFSPERNILSSLFFVTKFRLEAQEYLEILWLPLDIAPDIIPDYSPEAVPFRIIRPCPLQLRLRLNHG